MLIPLGVVMLSACLLVVGVFSPPSFGGVGCCVSGLLPTAWSTACAPLGSYSAWLGRSLRWSRLPYEQPADGNCSGDAVDRGELAEDSKVLTT